MTIQDYIKEYYDNNTEWFVDEVKQPWHMSRINNVLNMKSYLKGNHKIKGRFNAQHKGAEYITRKIVLQTAKTILNFHSTYLMGKPVSLVGSEDMVKQYNKVYRNSKLNNIDYKIMDSINKYGDCYEYLFVENGQIKSKLINSSDGYPVYSDEGEYIAFIEYYCVDNVSTYYVYYDKYVEKYTDAGGELHLLESKYNVSGLPVHYHNIDDEENNFGRSELLDIIPILDEIEDILSKMGDAVYTLSLNPLPTVIGQRIEGSVPAEAIGYCLNLEDGSDFKFGSATMDYSTIKLYLDNLKEQLVMVSSMPSVAMGNTNVSNVSEVSLKLLYQMADVKAMMNERYIREGFSKRFEIINRLLEKMGITFNENDYIDVEFNYARPINTSELIDNLKKQREMMAISVRTVIEKSELTNDVQQEIERLEQEGALQDVTGTQNNDVA